VNAKGSSIGKKKIAWTFTVDASIYTFAPIDAFRLERMAYLADDLSDWIINEFGLHNVTFDTLGSATDMPTSNQDARGHGFYYCHLDVEDVTMAKGDYRSRQDIRSVNADMLNESQQRESYTFVGSTLFPRLAPDLRMHISETIRQLISEGLKRFLAGVVG